MVVWVDLPAGFSIWDPAAAAVHAANARSAAAVYGALSAFCEGADVLVAYNGTGLDFEALDTACAQAGVRPIDVPARVDALYLAYTWWPTQPSHRLRPLATAVGVNVGFKAAFYYLTALAQVGLALATSIGAWLNLGLVIWFAVRRGHLAFDPALRSATVRLTTAGLALAAVLWLTHAPVARLFADWTSWRDESTPKRNWRESSTRSTS